MNYNKVILAGNLTRDPETKALPSGATVAAFSIAINRRWKDANGQQKEEVCFVDCAAFGKTAEAIQQYLHKGNGVLVEGRLRQDHWETQGGEKRNKLSVVAESVQFIGGGEHAENKPAEARQPTPKAPPKDDDIPF